MKNNAYRIILFLFSFLVFIFHDSSLSAQVESLPEDDVENAGRFFIAPDFGLMLGTVTRIEVSPALGYYLTNRISVAAGGRYEYLKESRSYYSYNAYSTHIYGMRLYGELDVIKNLNNVIPLGLNSGIFGHIEYEGLSLEKQYFDFPYYPANGRFWHSTALIGAGLRQPAGQRASFNLLFLWDTDTSSRSLYNNPIVRMGFQIYLR